MFNLVNFKIVETMDFETLTFFCQLFEYKDFRDFI